MKNIKQKSNFIIFLTFCSLMMFAQETENAFDSKGLRHGSWKGYYDDTAMLRYEGNFNHGKETGLFTYYAKGDKIIVMATRKFDDKGNAYTTFFDETKNKVSEGNMVNKQREGTWTYYHKNSKEVMTLEKYSKDKLTGIRKVFYITGKLAEETNYVNGMKEGVSKKFSKQGVLIEESIFVKDQLEGNYIVYDESSNIAIKGQFKNNKKKGIWSYYEKGKLVKEIDKDKVKTNGATKIEKKK
jgi:antitoxin component YwqK of YwqJK toxin-antitoxin module